MLNRMNVATLTQSRYDEVGIAKPLKKRPLPTVAHNYSFWTDLIFEPDEQGERNASDSGGNKQILMEPSFLH